MLLKKTFYPSNKANSKKKNIRASKKILDFIAYCDGTNNLEHISKLIKTTFSTSKKIMNILKQKKIIKIL